MNSIFWKFFSNLSFSVYMDVVANYPKVKWGAKTPVSDFFNKSFKKGSYLMIAFSRFINSFPLSNWHLNEKKKMLFFF